MPEDTPAVDEATQEAPEGDPQAEAPAEETSTEETSTTADPYEKRYNDLRSQYDRIHPRASQLEEFVNHLRNPETQAEALRALGLELEADEVEEDEELDYDDRFERLEGYLTDQAEQAAEREVQELEQEYVDQELSKLDGDLSKQEKELVISLADQLRDEDGIPDVQAAHEAFKEATDANLKRYRESKKAPSVGNGQAGTEKIDMSDDDARTQYLADLLEAGQAD